MFKYLLLATVPPILVLLIGEGVARLWPWDFAVRRPVFIPSGHEEYFGTQRVFLPYQARSPYYWLPVANTPLTNSRGFRGAEVAESKAQGSVRVVCLGCSCTLGGQEPYPQRMERLLTEALGTKKCEVVNAGVGSSSTYQGLQLLQKHVLDLQPDLVTVFFGWNDRWVHDGRRDAQHRLPSAAEQRLVALLSYSRLVKALIFVADRWRGQQLEQRVPAVEYAANLRQIVRLCRARGIRVLLCTTPDGTTPQAIEHRFLRDNNPVNRTRELYALFKDKGATPVDTWNYIQRLYNQQVHTVAETDRVELVDLDREIAARRGLYPAANLRFYKDGMHFTELGLQEVARLLALQVASGRDREAVQRYTESPGYYRSNAVRFGSQYQYAAAGAFLDRAQALGGAGQELEPLRAKITADLPFYDQYEAAKFDLYNGGDAGLAFQALLACLQQRPEDQWLRVDLGRVALMLGAPQVTFSLLRDPSARYDNSQALNEAMWLIAEAANRTGQKEVLMNQLRETQRQFPQDQEARAILKQLSH